MIDLDLIQKAREIGIREFRGELISKLEAGQVFYTELLGDITFMSNVKDESGWLIPVFKTSSGVRSCDYFFRDLINFDGVFISKKELEDYLMIGSVVRAVSRFEDKDEALRIILKRFCDCISIEVNYNKKDLNTTIESVSDVITSDNGGVILSVDVG